MGGLTLLAEARTAGLTVHASGDQVVVTGPRTAASLAERILADKHDVLAVLRQRARFTADPRPDLIGDSKQWGRLLEQAFDFDGMDTAGLCGALHGLRCSGAKLVAEAGRLRLTAGEMSDAEYAELRDEYLVSHATTLRRLLNDVAGA